jgi:hypothetical protein
MVAPSCGKACQISSVTNGAIGCNKRATVLSTNESTAARVGVGTLVASRYQSQYSYQAKSSSTSAATPNSKRSSARRHRFDRAPQAGQDPAVGQAEVAAAGSVPPRGKPSGKPRT